MKFSKLPIALLFGSLAEVQSHGVAVYGCLSTVGTLRIFIEHWHGNLGSTSSAGSMTIKDNHSGAQLTKIPDGLENDKTWQTLPGCSNGIQVTPNNFCSGDVARYNDFVYYDFPTGCNIPTSYTLLSGNTVVLTESCSSLYPATFTQTFGDLGKPALTINGASCADGGSVTVNVEADYTCNGFTTVWNQPIQASNPTWNTAASDDCDANPLITDPFNNANAACSGGALTPRAVSATDNTQKTTTCTALVNVITSTDPCAASPMPTIVGGGYRTPSPTTSPTPAPTPSPSVSPSAEPSASPSVSPTSTPTVSPTTHITPWLVGPSTYTLNGGNNYFDGYLGVSNPIGSKANLNNVVVQLFDFNCLNQKDNMNSTNAVTIFATDTTQAQTFGYSVNISQSNIGDDTGGFFFPTGPSTGDVKFCTRVSTWEGSVEVAFRETNFILSYDLTNNTFALSNILIQENNPDSFITDVDTDFSVLVYQCNNYLQTTPHTLLQDENLVICLEPFHPGGMAHVVHISNFNIKMFAGTVGSPTYVEYNPVWFSTGGWNHDSLTSVSEQPDPADIIMISTPVIAQFFIQSHTSISLSGNCFLEFDSNKDAKAPVFVGFDMTFGVVEAAEEGCLVSLIRRIRGLF